MVDVDVILAKTRVIQRCLQRIREETSLDPDLLDTFIVQDSFVLNLLRAIQAVVQMAAHIVASEGWGLPDEMKATFNPLYEHRIVNKELKLKLQSMIGFRNLAIHDYEEINLDILKSVLTDRLEDLELFYKRVLQYYKITEAKDEAD